MFIKRSTYNELIQGLDEACDENKSLEEALEAAEDDVVQLTAANDKLECVVDDQQEEIDNLLSQLDEKDCEIAQLESTIDSLSNE